LPYKSDGELFRSDDNQGALLSADLLGLEQYRRTKKAFKQLNKIEQLEQRVAKLEKLVEQSMKT